MIDQTLLDFIRGAVPSVWALELLLFLKREPGRAWEADALVQELRSSRTAVGEALATFETAGLARCDEEGCAYAPASPLLAELCDTLERTYRQRPVAVINAIARSKQDALQSFADAFRIKDD